MTRALRVEPEALAELKEATSWYERERPRLGVDFALAVEQAVDRVRELPGAFPVVMERPLVRRALLRRFPYAVVFTVHQDTIHLLAVAHAKRRPLYWAHRVADEDE
jgi:plasmid stabilization system protein ParE